MRPFVVRWRACTHCHGEQGKAGPDGYYPRLASDVPACAACHGPMLTGVTPNVPGLLGLPLDDLNSQLGAWRTGSRQAHGPDCMSKVVKGLSNDDLAAVTHFLPLKPCLLMHRLLLRSPWH